MVGRRLKSGAEVEQRADLAHGEATTDQSRNPVDRGEQIKIRAHVAPSHSVYRLLARRRTPFRLQ